MAGLIFEILGERAMAWRRYTNTAVPTTLTTSISAQTKSVRLASASGWPVPGTREEVVAVIDPGLPSKMEVITYTGISGKTLTGVTRGADGTAAQAHAAQSHIRHAVSAADIPNGKNSGQVNVLDWGAKGDSAHDDTRGIQAACDAAAVAGGVVFLPPGRYLVSDTIHVPAGVSVLGSGDGRTLNPNVDEDKGIGTLIDARTVEHVVFEKEHDVGFFFGRMEITGVLGNYLSDGTVDDSRTDLWGPTAIFGGDGSLQQHYFDISIWGFTNGIVLGHDAGYHFTVERCIFEGVRNHGLAIVGLTDGTVRECHFGNHVDGDGSGCLYIASAAHDSDPMAVPISIRVERSFFDEGGAPSLYIRDGRDITCDSLHVWQGIQLGDGVHAGPTRTIITNSYVGVVDDDPTLHGAEYCVRIEAGTTDTTLQNVKTDPSSAGGHLGDDIVDHGTRTVKINVNQSGAIE